MAHDLFLKKSNRDWSRSSSTSSTGSTIVCFPQPRAKTGWVGPIVGITLATRLVTGRWPWSWFGMIAKRIEGSSDRPATP